jgi:AraC-like DNA-binding protein
MRTLKQFEPLVIHDFTEGTFHMESHGHTYYEIGYIYGGTGIHYLNNSALNYQRGDIFVLCPEDSHTFKIKKTTRFVFIKFTDSYFRLFDGQMGDTTTGQDPLEIMNSKYLKENKLDILELDAQILKNTIDNIVAFDRSDQLIINSRVIYHQILSVLALVKDNLSRTETGFRIETDDQLMISYIHQHIYTPADLKISTIADHFNIAPKYFSAYFKRVYHISYSAYVQKYKASLIALRLQSRQFTLRQIAEEFGFTDESHLSRFFKKSHKKSPGAYRNQ